MGARLGVVPAAMAAAVLLTACGGNDKPSSQGGEAATLKITASQPASGQYRIDVPPSVKGGLVRIEFHNADKVLREAQLIRIAAPHTIDEVLADKAGPSADWLSVAGGVGDTKPGATSTTIQALPPGGYYVIDSNSGEDKHARAYDKQGAVAPFEATGPPTPGTLPSAPASITITDGAPGLLATGLKPGSNRVLIDNVSSHYNAVAVVPILPGKTLADVRKYLTSGQSGPSPLDTAHSVATTNMEGGKAAPVTRQVAQLDLEPGRYALTSYLHPPAGGPTFAERGFVAEVDVSGPALSRPEFVAKGDAICAQYADERDAFELRYGRTKDDSLATYGRIDEARKRGLERLIADFDALQPPEDGKALKAAFLGTERRRTAALSARIAAEGKRDPAAIGRANAADEALRAPAMAGYGFKNCGLGSRVG